jgi:hypothetical protein
MNVLDAVRLGMSKPPPHIDRMSRGRVSRQAIIWCSAGMAAGALALAAGDLSQVRVLSTIGHGLWIPAALGIWFSLDYLRTLLRPYARPWVLREAALFMWTAPLALALIVGGQILYRAGGMEFRSFMIAYMATYAWLLAAQIWAMARPAMVARAFKR